MQVISLRAPGTRCATHSRKGETSTMAIPQLWPIFICYRRSDGIAVARRLHEMLDKWQTAGPEGQPIQLDAYLDETMPGVADWKGLHRPYLEKARAIIVVCTPGAKLNEGPADWVHREIDWWLEHRDVAPILIDPLGEGVRYVPSQIVRRWPDIQRIALVEEDWENLSEVALEEKTAAVRRQILGTILPSGAEIYAQELEEERRRAQWLRRALVVSMVLLASATSAGGYAFYQRRAAQVSERMAEASLLDSRAAGFFARARLLETRREVETIRRNDLVRRIASSETQDPSPGTRRRNLDHELAQLNEDLHQLKAESMTALTKGRELLDKADAAWKDLVASGSPSSARAGSRPEPPHIFSVELINAGHGESILLHYGTPDDIKLVMINGGPRRNYKEFVEARLQELSAARFDGRPVPIELFIVGDQDQDKTEGLLLLLRHLAERESSSERLVKLHGVWANIFRIDGGREYFREHIRRLIDELKVPLNEPFDHLVMRPDKGPAVVTLAGGLEIIILGPERSRVARLYANARREAERHGGKIEPLQRETHSGVNRAVVPPMGALPMPASSAPGDCIRSENARRLAGGTYADGSAANLASTVLLFRYSGRTFLYTGDARGDLILEGLERAGLTAQGRVHVDLLTIPHAGSHRSSTVEFFDEVRASGYLFSGDGRFGNPEIPTVAALITARGCDPYRMYFVNRDGEDDEHGAKLDAFFRDEQPYKPNYRRIFRSLEQGSVVVDLLDPLRN
jgi:hypothetical protein